MSATIITEPLVTLSSSSANHSNATPNPNPNLINPAANQASSHQIESALCDCCGLTEDCTPEYISRIRERYAGRWICGLCSEAVKEEIVRSAAREERLILPEEAVARCRKLRMDTDPDPDPTAELIAAVRRILRRSLDGRGGTT